LRIENNTTPRVDFPEPQHVWSDPEGNIRAPWREVSLFRSQQLFIPRDGEFGLVPSLGEARFYIAPGETFSRNARRSFERLRVDLRKATEFPARIELEFSSPANGPSSRPQAYRTLLVDWALSVCDAVVICIDRDPGSAAGEAHRVLAPIQVVFRSREKDVQTWCDFLRPRLKGRHELSVVRSNNTAAGT
jgi:hypothetical protein